MKTVEFRVEEFDLIRLETAAAKAGKSLPDVVEKIFSPEGSPYLPATADTSSFFETEVVPTQEKPA